MISARAHEGDDPFAVPISSITQASVIYAEEGPQDV